MTPEEREQFQQGLSSVPTVTQRGSFNAISASVQQLSGGIASVVADHIVTLGADGQLEHFGVLGYVVTPTSLVALTLLWLLQRTTQ